MAPRRPFKSRSHLADMSLPPEQRARNKKTTRKKGKGATAQMTHAGGQPRINDRRRTWEKQAKQRRR